MKNHLWFMVHDDTLAFKVYDTITTNLQLHIDCNDILCFTVEEKKILLKLCQNSRKLSTTFLNL